MNQVEELTKSLIDAVAECEEYTRYQNAKRMLDKYPILKDKANEFRKQNYYFQNNSADPFEDGEKLQQEFASVIEHPIVWEYLVAENAFCRILRQINWQLLENLDFEFNFDGE